jgi:hypothetical protein
MSFGGRSCPTCGSALTGGASTSCEECGWTTTTSAMVPRGDVVVVNQPTAAGVPSSELNSNSTGFGVERRRRDEYSDDDDATVSSYASSSYDDDIGRRAVATTAVHDDRVEEEEDYAATTTDALTPRERERLAAEQDLIENGADALKLLYMMSLYTGLREEEEEDLDSDEEAGANGDEALFGRSSNNKKKKLLHRFDDAPVKYTQRWLRELPALVLIYEGILREVFDYDYAPEAEKVFGGARMYMNISEEGRDDLEDLRELGFLEALKVTSETYEHSTLLKISESGIEFLRRVSAPDGGLTAEMRALVEALVYENDDELLEVRFDKPRQSFYLTAPRTGYEFRSSITDVEDVPYVSSPYIPLSMISSDAFAPNTMSGDKKAKRILGASGAIAASPSALRDQNLTTSLTLDDIRVFVTEWVPMGSNEMVSFCEKLGTGDRVPGGMFSSSALMTPQQELDMVVSVHSDNKTKIRVLDADETRHVNVEADLLATGIKDNVSQLQIEHFGINFRDNGTITYGLFVNGIANRIRDKISLDLLARLLSDVHEDTSELVGNLFSERQRSMLDKTYKGEADNRDKFVCIIAERATPKLRAELYMDGEQYENELKQIIGATYNAYDLSEQEVIVFGAEGMIIFGPRTERHHKLLAAYAALQARSVYVKNVFSSCFALTDELKRTRALIDDYQSDPMHVVRIRARLAEHTTSATILHAVQQFLLESLESMETSRQKLTDAADAASQELFDICRLEEATNRLNRRVVDLEKVISACWNDLESLRQMNHVIGSRRKLQINESIEGTTKNLEDAFRAQARNSTTLEVTQVILSGTLAFDILDRFTGQYLSYTDIRWAVDKVQPYIVNVPAAWFMLNMAMWVCLGGGIIYLMRHLAYMGCSVETKRFTLNKPIHVKRWKRFILTRDVESVSQKEESSRRVVKYGWSEPEDVDKWRGSPPKIDITVDERYGYVLQAMIIVNKRTCKLSGEEAWRIFWRDAFVNRSIHDASREIFDEETGDRKDTTEYSDDEDEEDGYYDYAGGRGASTIRKKPPTRSKSSIRRRSTAGAGQDDENDDDEDDGALANDFTFETFVAQRKSDKDAEARRRRSELRAQAAADRARAEYNRQGSLAPGGPTTFWHTQSPSTSIRRD